MLASRVSEDMFTAQKGVSEDGAGQDKLQSTFNLGDACWTCGAGSLYGASCSTRYGIYMYIYVCIYKGIPDLISG